jgi:4-azaleucine resistance transporter AzlC
MKKSSMRHSLLPAALKYSVPVFFGYIAIGVAFGLLVSDAGYPWQLSLLMSIFMYTGAGQFTAVGLFAAGTGILEAALIQLVLNARHAAYGLSMLNRFKNAGLYRFYLIFGLSDETFALLSSIPETSEMEEKERAKFMFYITALDQCYWVTGTVLGAAAGALIPFNTEGIGFALTAMFVVLMIEKILTVRKAGIFILSAIPAVLGVIFLPSRISLLAALAISLTLSLIAGKINRRVKQ